MHKSARHALDVQVTSVRLVAKSAVILVVRIFCAFFHKSTLERLSRCFQIINLAALAFFITIFIVKDFKGK